MVYICLFATSNLILPFFLIFDPTFCKIQKMGEKNRVAGWIQGVRDNSNLYTKTFHNHFSTNMSSTKNPTRDQAITFTREKCETLAEFKQVVATLDASFSDLKSNNNTIVAREQLLEEALAVMKIGGKFAGIQIPKMFEESFSIVNDNGISLSEFLTVCEGVAKGDQPTNISIFHGDRVKMGSKGFAKLVTKFNKVSNNITIFSTNTRASLNARILVQENSITLLQATVDAAGDTTAVVTSASNDIEEDDKENKISVCNKFRAKLPSCAEFLAGYGVACIGVPVVVICYYIDKARMFGLDTIVSTIDSVIDSVSTALGVPYSLVLFVGVVMLSTLFFTRCVGPCFNGCVRSITGCCASMGNCLNCCR